MKHYLLGFLLLVMTGCGSDGLVAGTQAILEGDVSRGVAAARGSGDAGTNTTVGGNASIQTSASEPVQEPAATVVATMEEKLVEKQVHLAYGALMLLEASTGFLEETALRVQSGELDRSEALGRLRGTGAALQRVNESLAELVPALALEEAWQEGLVAVPRVAGATRRWTDEQLMAADVPGELGALQRELEMALQTLETTLDREYRIDNAALTQLREEAMTELRAVLDRQTRATATGASSVEEPASRPLIVEVVSHRSYVDGGWLHIVGEVENRSDRPVESTKVMATLYDNGEVSGKSFAYTLLDVIPAGAKAPFEISTDAWTGTTTYDLQVQARPGAARRTDLVVVNHRSYSNSGWLHVQGDVVNEGTDAAKAVKVVITLYDAEEQVVGVDYAFTELDVLPPGGSSAFESATDHWPDFDHYEIVVQGR